MSGYGYTPADPDAWDDELIERANEREYRRAMRDPDNYRSQWGYRQPVKNTNDEGEGNG